LSGVYETVFHDLLREIQEDRPDLISAEVEVGEVYGFYRSLRRGVTTWARECGVSEGDIDLINRWRKIEEARGRKPGLSIRDHYTEVVQLKSSKLRFSRAI
jgi:hypothetical protein